MRPTDARLARVQTASGASKRPAASQNAASSSAAKKPKPAPAPAPPPAPAHAPAPATSSAAAKLPAQDLVDEFIGGLSAADATAALVTLGLPRERAAALDDTSSRAKLRELVTPTATSGSCSSPQQLLLGAAESALTIFLQAHEGKTDEQARLAARNRLSEVSTDILRKATDIEAIWNRLILANCPPAPKPPDRGGHKVLVIAPGFGFQANAEQIRCVERAGFTVKRSDQHANPEEFKTPSEMQEKLMVILGEIACFKPDAILCASKGGAYMSELWKQMDNGTLDKIASLMINAHPSVKSLPKDVKVVLVQGSEEKPGWHRPRGYNKYGQVADGSLEALIRTGTPGLCYLYHTVESLMTKRKGDKHDAASLLKEDCLPRLIDALMAPKPPYSFPTSSARFLSNERLEAESTLGYHPEKLKERFEGTDLRVELSATSKEYEAVECIFQAEPPPNVKRFYTQQGTSLIPVTKIERVQNRDAQDQKDNNHVQVKRMMQRAGVEYLGGVHSRWLFHGTSDAPALDNIIGDPMEGFADAVRHRWGEGAYFARDAAYSVGGGYCDDCLDGDGNRMILLCLVETGLPCVGEEDLSTRPKVHPTMSLKYNSFVDWPSNPEVFSVKGQHAYPAYVIHFE